MVISRSKEAGRDSVTVHPSRSTMDGRKKGVALGGLGVPEEHVVPQGLHVLYCGSTRAWCPDFEYSVCELRTWCPYACECETR